MQPYIADSDFTLYVGDALEVLAELPDRSVDCVVTSPPYWGLRDYGTATWEGGDPACDHKQGRDGAGRADGKVDDRSQRNRDGIAALTRRTCRCGATRVDDQLGLERTPAEYVAALVAIFEQARRVLADHGTLWLNLGDSYSQDTKWGGSSSSKNELRQGYARPTERGSSGLKPKDMVGIPWRVAFSLQDAGWYLRSDIIWAKPNAMPASVTDRPTTAHEYVFLLAKSRRYFFDQDAVREPYVGEPEDRYGRVGAYQNRAINGIGDGTTPTSRRGLTGGAYAPPGQPPHGNARQPTLSPDLPPEAPRGPDGRRQTHVEGRDGSAQHRDGERWANTGRNIRSVWTIPTAPYAGAHFATFPRELALRCIQAGCPEGGTVLDPFMGSGTTALAARAAGRKAIGIELSPAYAAICADRTNQLTLELEGSAT